MDDTDELQLPRVPWGAVLGIALAVIPVWFGLTQANCPGSYAVGGEVSRALCTNEAPPLADFPDFSGWEIIGSDLQSVAGSAGGASGRTVGLRRADEGATGDPLGSFQPELDDWRSRSDVSSTLRIRVLVPCERDCDALGLADSLVSEAEVVVSFAYADCGLRWGEPMFQGWWNPRAPEIVVSRDSCA